MTSGLDLGFAGGMINTLIDAAVMIFFVAVVGGMALFGYYTGLFKNYPYTCFVWSKKAGGSVELKKIKGRYLKAGEGKFELQYNPFDKVAIEAPSEEHVYPGNQIHFMRESKDAHFPLDVKINEHELSGDPSWSNASKLALYQELEKNAHRFGNDPLAKYVVHITFIIAVLIIAIAWLMATTQVVESMNQLAGQFDGVASKLADAEVILEKPPPVDGGTGAPPG